MQVHDIEDLVQFGQKEKACPFFISRDLNETAELVFCPYNYIVDPAIRSAMSIDLTGSVVIFDEAHVRLPVATTVMGSIARLCALSSSENKAHQIVTAPKCHATV